jgi:lipopolysaccharide transport system permease protein
MQSVAYHFDLVMHLARRDFVLQYKGSVLGIFWALLLPLSQLLVLVFLFQKVIPLDIADYPAFVFAALLPWTWFSNSVTQASGALFSNRDLLRQPNFRPFFLMIINALTNLFTFLVSLPVLWGLLTWSGRGMTLSWLFFVLLVLIQGVLIVGLGLIFSIWNVFYRDIRHLLSIAVMLLFYITPVFYRTQSVGKSYYFLFTWNPMAVLVQSYRAILFYGIAPDWGSLLIASIISAVVLGLGCLLYHRKMPDVFDAI